MARLKVGDRVIWRGCWGEYPPLPAVVTGIVVDGKAGDPVDSVDWADFESRGVVVDLDNGHWAYGYQLERGV